MTLAKPEAKILHEKISEKAYNHEDLIRILATRSKELINATLNHYKNEFGNDINKDLKTDPKDEFLAILRATTKCLTLSQLHATVISRKDDESTRRPRNESTHQRLYEFARTVLVKIFAHPYATVCELYCGGGLDADKWDEAQIGRYTGMDSGITQIRGAWESERKANTAEFFELDPCLREWQGASWRDDEKSGHTEPPVSLGKINDQKWILGPGPADLRFQRHF